LERGTCSPKLLTEDHIRRLKDPEFRDGMVRETMGLVERTGGELHQELPTLGHVFLQAIDALLPFESLSLEEEAIVRDAVRTQLHSLRISVSCKIFRFSGIFLTFTPPNFQRFQDEHPNPLRSWRRVV